MLKLFEPKYFIHKNVRYFLWPRERLKKNHKS